MAYTGDDEPFDWDDANVEHIARHGITPDEAEEALLDGGRFVLHARRQGERRWQVIGATLSGRLLSVIITRRGRSTRVVTAREADNRERRAYRRNQ